MKPILHFFFFFISIWSLHAQSSYSVILTDVNGFDYISDKKLKHSEYQTFFIVEKDNSYSIETTEYYGIPTTNSLNLLISNRKKDYPEVVGLTSKKELIKLNSNNKDLNIEYLALVDSNNNILYYIKLK